MSLAYLLCYSPYGNIHYAICWVLHELLSVRLMASIEVPVLKRGMRIMMFRITSVSAYTSSDILFSGYPIRNLVLSLLLSSWQHSCCHL